MAKAIATKANATPKPKVVFDLKMPQYEYQRGEGKSMSVDRKRDEAGKASLDCLTNLRG